MVRSRSPSIDGRWSPTGAVDDAIPLPNRAPKGKDGGGTIPHRWREMDSNHRFPVAIGQVRTPEWRSLRRKYLHSLGLACYSTQACRAEAEVRIHLPPPASPFPAGAWRANGTMRGGDLNSRSRGDGSGSCLITHHQTQARHQQLAVLGFRYGSGQFGMDGLRLPR